MPHHRSIITRNRATTGKLGLKRFPQHKPTIGSRRAGSKKCLPVRWMAFQRFVWCDNVRNNSRARVPFQFSNFAELKTGTAMKITFALKNITRSILIASVIFGVTGVVHAQSSTAKKSGGSTQNSSNHSYGKDAIKDYAISQGSGSHTYGKDQSKDYAQSQGTGFHSYGKDQSKDYAKSQESAGTTSGRATGMGSSSSQGSSTSGTSAGSGGY
jgi:hypothetical protein